MATLSPLGVVDVRRAFLYFFHTKRTQIKSCSNIKFTVFKMFGKCLIAPIPFCESGDISVRFTCFFLLKKYSSWNRRYKSIRIFGYLPLPNRWILISLFADICDVYMWYISARDRHDHTCRITNHTLATGRQWWEHKNDLQYYRTVSSLMSNSNTSCRATRNWQGEKLAQNVLTQIFMYPNQTVIQYFVSHSVF